MKIFINGKFVAKGEAKISVFDHGFLYGDGVFEGIRVYNRRVFKLGEHLQRLYRSAHMIALKIPYEIHKMREYVIKTVSENELNDGYLRIVLSRGPGDLGLDPRNCSEITVVIIASRIKLYPEDLYRSGVECITSSIRRSRADMLSPAIKSLNYLNGILAKLECIRADVAECIMLNHEGLVAECTVENIFICTDGIDGKIQLRTPSTASGILAGITRSVVMQIASELGIPCIEADVTQYDAYNATEVFMCGTASEIIPVVKIDGRQIGSGIQGSITRRIMERYRTLVRSEGEQVW